MKNSRSTTKRTYLVGLAILVSCAGGGLGAETRIKLPVEGKINTDRVNIRAGRSLNYEIVTKLDEGDRVVVTGRSGGWYQIMPPEGVTFWVAARYVSGGKVACGRLNVRAGPTTRSTVICQLRRGDRVDEMEEREGWIAIKPPDCARLWVSSELVDVVVPRVAAKETAPAPVLAGKREAVGEPAEAGAVTEAGEKAKTAGEPVPGRREAREPESKPRPCSYDGRLVRAEPGGPAGARHRLVGGFPWKRVVCMLRSRDVNLDFYVNDTVRVWGYEIDRLPSGVPLVDVRRLEVR